MMNDIHGCKLVLHWGYSGSASILPGFEMEAQWHKCVTTVHIHTQNILICYAKKTHNQSMEHLFHCHFDIQQDFFRLIYIGNISTPPTLIIHDSVQACILTATTAPWKLMILNV